MMSTKAVTDVRQGVIFLPGDRFFPEGITVAADGAFYVGSMEQGLIVRVPPGAREAEPFIRAGANGLISVLGLYVDHSRNLLWACSSDYGNVKLSGTAAVGVKAFDLRSGAARGSYDFPGGGFANDLTIDARGNLYVTDSWSPRILRLAAGGLALETWINDPQLGIEQWSLNGIDFDEDREAIYTVNQRTGELFRIVIEPDGSAGTVTLISTSRPLRRPDGLKVIGRDTLATAEGGAGGIAIIRVDGNRAEVQTVSEGLDNVTTFAVYQGSAWLVEGQADHFWDPVNAGPDATPPFRIVEIPLP